MSTNGSGGLRRRGDKADVQTVARAACSACGSTERTPYHRVETLHLDGVDADGRVYVSITLRRCACASCGRARIERTLNYP